MVLKRLNNGKYCDQCEQRLKGRMEGVERGKAVNEKNAFISQVKPDPIYN